MHKRLLPELRVYSSQIIATPDDRVYAGLIFFDSSTRTLIQIRLGPTRSQSLRGFFSVPTDGMVMI